MLLSAAKAALLHVNETDRLPERALQPETTRQIYETLGQQAIRVVSQGHSVVVDAVFADQTERTAIRDDASGSGVRFVGLYLQTDLATRPTPHPRSLRFRKNTISAPLT